MIRTAALLAALVAAAPSVAAQTRTDRLTPHRGPVVEGMISRETWKEVVIRPATGSEQTFKVEDVARLEYFDAPDAMKAAMADIETGNWQEALNKLNSAQDFVDGKGMQTKPKPPRPWFGYWMTYYRGRCLKELDRWDDAVKELQKHVDSVKDPNLFSRLLLPAYEAIMECHRAKNDDAALSGFAAQIQKAPRELQGKLNLVLDKQRAELLLDKKDAEGARPIFEKLAGSGDPQIKADGTAGVIRCYEQGRNPDALVNYCKGVINSTPPDQVGLLLLASNAIGNSHLERKKWREAVDALVASVVKYHPGRTSAQVKEHERALYLLARAYESWANDPGTSKDLGKQSKTWAERTWRELSMEYPNGRYREEAIAGIARCQSEEESKNP